MQSNIRKVTSPINPPDLEQLSAGDSLLLSGVIYTARDAAHKRLIETINAGEELPFDIKGQTIYYVGPSPSKPGAIIGSAGPTTSGRMDAFTPILLRQGLVAMIGKGRRNDSVVGSIKEYHAVYLAAIGGAAAAIAKSVKSVEIIAYEDLGTEAIRKLVVENMPLTVAIDSNGNDFYEQGRSKYLESTENKEVSR